MESGAESRGRILVVDDEIGMCEFLEFMLRDEGYEVESAHSGQEALEKLAEKDYSLILADIKMPGMDGLEMLRRIREIDSDAVVIVMTAYASLDTAVKAIKYNAYDYLVKPFDDTDKVLTIIERGLQKRRELMETRNGL